MCYRTWQDSTDGINRALFERELLRPTRTIKFILSPKTAIKH